MRLAQRWVIECGTVDIAKLPPALLAKPGAVGGNIEQVKLYRIHWIPAGGPRSTISGGIAYRRFPRGPAAVSAPQAVGSANFATALLTSISGSSWAAQRNDVMRSSTTTSTIASGSKGRSFFSQ